MTTAILRPLQAHEAAAYRAIRLECLRLHPGWFGTTYAEAAAEPQLAFERHIERQDADHVMFGAFVAASPDGAGLVDGALCGICGFTRDRRQRARHRGELTQMYVAPHAAGRGIGGGLIDAVVQHALRDPTMQQIVLGVVADNAAAIRAYQRAGFREYGRLDGYFRAEDICSAQVFMVYQRA